MRRPVICLAEDRSWCEPGVRLLVASLARHSPDIPVELFYPPADSAFKAWLARFPQVSLNKFRLTEPWRGWNVKPEALLTLLAAGFDDVLWVDTDIVVARDVGGIFADLSIDTMVVAEEALCSSHYDGDAMRARLWGLDVGRALRFQLNGGVVGVTSRHVGLVERWRDVLNSPEYLEAQKLRWDLRPRHFMADQEVLTALLCSSEFSKIPLRYLTRGRDIVQYFGSACYTLRERATNVLRGPPVFIHSQGHKAWTPLPRPDGIKTSLLNLYQRMSPYVGEARKYRDELPDPSWLKPSTTGDRILSGMSFGAAPLAGLPIAIVNDLYRWVRWAHTGGEPRR